VGGRSEWGVSVILSDTVSYNVVVWFYSSLSSSSCDKRDTISHRSWLFVADRPRVQLISRPFIQRMSLSLLC
jgi:hypothetical protein